MFDFVFDLDAYRHAQAHMHAYRIIHTSALTDMSAHTNLMRTLIHICTHKLNLVHMPIVTSTYVHANSNTYTQHLHMHSYTCTHAHPFKKILRKESEFIIRIANSTLIFHLISLYERA